MKTQHTPGEWRYNQIDKTVTCNGFVIAIPSTYPSYDPCGIEICNNGESWLDMRDRTKPLRDNQEQEMEANAKLIASAPKMLETLIRIEKTYRNMYEMGCLYSDQHNDWVCIKDAIEKATE